MPIDRAQKIIPSKEAHKEQTNEDESILEQYVDSSDDDDDDEEEEEDEDEDEDDFVLDQELENAYQCDFTKRVPPPCRHTSLLSSLLSCSSQPNVKQSNTKRDHSAPITISSSKKYTNTADPLSESLKRNLAWEHSQNSLLKYENIKRSGSSGSLTDNFSRY